jgi:50S ribosomal protein L4
VVGGNQKPWRQKGTGRARQGSIRAPNWPGGGTVFGPSPRKYTQSMPRQAKALARKSALNARAGEGALHVIDAFQYEAPKTATLVQLLARLDVAHKKVLILTDGVKPNVFLSGRNLPKVRVMPFSDASTYDVLWSDVVLVESGALGTALAPVAEKALAKVKVKKVENRSRKPEEGKAAEGKAKAAKKAAAKKTQARVAAKKAAPKAAKKAAPKASGSSAKKSAPKKKGK